MEKPATQKVKIPASILLCGVHEHPAEAELRIRKHLAVSAKHIKEYDSLRPAEPQKKPKP